MSSLPQTWKIKKIKEFSVIVTGNTPPTKDQDNFGEDYPWITPTDITSKKEIYTSARKLSKQGYAIARALPKGTVLITSIASIGKNAILMSDGSCNQQINAILPSENHDSDFIYYWFEKNTHVLQNLSGKTAVPILNKTDFSNIQLPLPPLPEQQKIAEILSTVDKKIDSIDTKIKETQTLKRGLMQRLLSEGIGHSEFKESEIGRIPMGWDYQTFEEAKIQIIDGDRGTNYPKQHDFFQEGFCLFLSAKNVTKRGFEFFEKQFITEEKDSLLRKGKLAKFDIVLTTRGTVGNIAYFDSSVPFENMRINSGMVLIRIQENLDAKYLYKIMTSELIQKNIQNIAFGSAQPQLTVKEIKNFKIPIPPLEEQKQIAEILSTTDEKLESLRAKKEAFETLKKGLMQKLLSGEVRVNV